MNDPALKRKISERWNIISRGQRHNPFPTGRESTAFAQLEYILIEAGLLAQRRAPRRERKMLEETEPEILELPSVLLESERFSARSDHDKEAVAEKALC
jgi:hypothetical protein